MMWLVRRIRSLVRNDDGATSIEYAVMLGLICIAVIASFGALTNAMKDSFDASGNAVNSVLGGST
jgi:Flp pilus assembly pilin Flp